MLVKCVCTDCGHSYLSDDQAGDLACPRCGVNNEGSRNPSDIPDAPMGVEPGVYDPYAEDEYGWEPEGQFDPQAPPPMYVTGDRMVRGIAFGLAATLALGAIVGAALSAIRVTVPVVAAIVLAFTAGAACRYGFGGRTSERSKMRARVVVTLVVVLGFAGFFVGSWAVERFTGSRAKQAREDLNSGLSALVRERAHTRDTGEAMLLERRITETEHLKALSDAEIEDYLWRQQAQLNQALLAYTKLRATEGPLVRLGPDSDPITVPTAAMAGILLFEIALAVFLAARGVMPR